MRTRKRAWHVVLEERGKGPRRYTIFAIMPHTAIYQVLRANPQAAAFTISVVPLPGPVTATSVGMVEAGEGPRIASYEVAGLRRRVSYP